MLMNAAGCGCTTAVELDALFASDADAVVSKSCTLEPRTGNDRPRIYLSPDGNSLNSIGLANPGLQYYIDYSNTLKTTITKPFILSFHPFSPKDLSMAIKRLSEVKHTIQMLEINLSCPNVVAKSSEFNVSWVRTYLEILSQSKCSSLVCGVKLWPIFSRSEIAKMAILFKEFADVFQFVTLCNSIPNGLMIDSVLNATRIRPNDGLGGIGGPAAKSFALANVYQFGKLLAGSGIKIIGCGGISNSQDAYEYLLCGAHALQIGTHLIRNGPQCFTSLQNQLLKINSPPKPLFIPSKL
jgi:dihydroorotate dehydrogenase (fumarate)